MPSLALAAARTNAPKDVKYTGAFYEGGQITMDGKGRPWITYRHFYTPWVGIVPEHHKQDSYLLYARCLLNDHWAQIVFLRRRPRAMVSNASSCFPKADGITAVWRLAARDRRKTDKPRGVVRNHIPS